MERWKLRKPEIRPCLHVGVILISLLVLAGCAPSPPTDRQLQRQAEQDAHQVRHDLRDAGKETKQALLNARRETQDVIAGARQGWKEGSPNEGGTGAEGVDVNSASAAELETLPGVTPSVARRIIADRPYSRADALLEQGIVSREEWDRIRGRVRTR